MEKNEIKKMLYKVKPNAFFVKATKEGLLYKTNAAHQDYGYIKVSFLIPLSDIGDAVFEADMESHLLIRYLIN